MSNTSFESETQRTKDGLAEVGTVVYNGKRYSAWGAVVTPDRATAYLGKDGVVTDWHGQPLGTYRIVATWHTPRSFVSSSMHQVEATIEGIRYTGRSAGVGMVWNGKRKRDSANPPSSPTT